MQIGLDEDKYHLNFFLKPVHYFWLLSVFFFCFLYQQTPLHNATKEGHEYTVDSLVKKGANIDVQDKAGVSMTTLLQG